jgi:chromosomal replication initiation ATPase DnaA
MLPCPPNQSPSELAALSGPPIPGRQLRLDLAQPEALAGSDFVTSPTNAAARAALDAWPDWANRALVLVGPEGSGKSHLAGDWAGRAAALPVPAAGLAALDFEALADRPVVVDDADLAEHGEALFHLINRAAAGGGGLLLTARTRPSQWETALPDLRSRLNALAVAELGEPDDVVLAGVLQKLFRARNIRPSDDLLPYLVKRIERSVPRARDIVARLDELADEERRAVTRALARRILDGEDDTPDLFD